VTFLPKSWLIRVRVILFIFLRFLWCHWNEFFWWSTCTWRILKFWFLSSRLLGRLMRWSMIYWSVVFWTTMTKRLLILVIRKHFFALSYDILWGIDLVNVTVFIFKFLFFTDVLQLQSTILVWYLKVFSRIHSL
jgi:hypothetical protein